MNNLAALILLFAGLNVTNAVVSGLLWFEHRTPLHRSFMLMWCGCSAAAEWARSTRPATSGCRGASRSR